MKKVSVVLFAFLLLAAGNVFSAEKQIKDFQEAMEILKSGKNIKVVIYYGQCQLISSNEIRDYSPDAIGGMSIDTWEYFAENAIGNENAFVVTSTSHLIENPIGDGYVFNYVKIKLSADEKVRLTARYLDPLSNEEIMDENFFSTINDGKNEGAVYLYEID